MVMNVVSGALLEWMETTGVQRGSGSRGCAVESSGVKLKGVEQIWSYRQRETVRIHSDRDPCVRQLFVMNHSLEGFLYSH